MRRQGRRLRIAQVAPLFESVPPAGYGGTERVVSYLTEALVEMGHDDKVLDEAGAFDWVAIRGLGTPGRSADLLLQRYERNVGVDVLRKDTGVQVAAVL